ncbi:MAG: hypothetical protein KDA61_20180 [Planctomycetales bacterium]|nr:hypothetical protein [Planctomycetales bacterium]
MALAEAVATSNRGKGLGRPLIDWLGGTSGGKESAVIGNWRLISERPQRTPPAEIK